MRGKRLATGVVLTNAKICWQRRESMPSLLL